MGQRRLEGGLVIAVQFGIVAAAAGAILSELRDHPGVFARCSSEMPFFPRRLGDDQLPSRRPGRPDHEATFEFNHSSDLDASRPINRNRQRQYCGDASIMNDLGMQELHVPLRPGWAASEV